MIDTITIAQAVPEEAQGICNAGFGDVLLGAFLFLGGMLFSAMAVNRTFHAPIMAGAVAASKGMGAEAMSPADKAKRKIQAARYRSAFDTGGRFDKTDDPIEKLQNAYARGQIDLDRFELLVAGAICKEEGYDKDLLKQDFDDPDTEDN